MLRLAYLALLATLAACASVKSAPQGDVAYSGTVQRAYDVTKPGKTLPGTRFLGRWAPVVAPLRYSSETHQYVLRTPTGQIMAQSDQEFAVGDCLDVLALGGAAGPAFKLGQAELIRSDRCSTLAANPPQPGN